MIDLRSGEVISNVQLFRHRRSGVFYLGSVNSRGQRCRVSAADVLDFAIDDVAGAWLVSTCSRILFRRRYLDALLAMPAADADVRVCDGCGMWFDASLRGCCE
jgi:hypothetical protein